MRICGDWERVQKVISIADGLGVRMEVLGQNMWIVISQAETLVARFRAVSQVRVNATASGVKNPANSSTWWKQRIGRRWDAA